MALSEQLAQQIKLLLVGRSIESSLHSGSGHGADYSQTMPKQPTKTLTEPCRTAPMGQGIRVNKLL